jgi:signal transduction histidine kinase/CheY-like chemotaxis protein
MPTEANKRVKTAVLGAAPQDITRLVERLSRAESELSAAEAGQGGGLVRPEAHADLLRDAHEALLQSEAAAKEAAALLRAIVENAPDRILYVGVDRRIRYTNKVLNARGDHPEHPDYLSIQLPDQREAVARVFESVVSTGKSASYEGPVVGANGNTIQYFSRHLGPVIDDGVVVGVVVVTRDITQQKNAEAQVLVSDRMASVGTLAAGVAHEINNPLAAVIANLDVAARDLKMLGERTATVADLSSVIAEAREAAHRVGRIVRDLKIFSRADDDDHQAVDVERVLESTLRMAWNEIRHRSTLVKEYTDVPLVDANEGKLGQVFLNLLVNAAQAIPEGNAEGNFIRISTETGADGRVVVKIADSGPGIPPETQRRLFTPFFTTKSVGAGTGLGLSICHRIITALGGEISFASEVGKGTEFRVVLPVARSRKQAVVEPVRTASVASRRGQVLIVDDEIAVGHAAQRILAPEHDVTVVDTGARALELIQRGERFDLVLCDLMMPQMTGMELYAQVSRVDPAQAARFVFMTGGAFTGRAREFLDKTTNDRLEKPFEMDDLRAMINGRIG